MKGMTFNKGWNKLYRGIVVDNLVNIDLPAINYLSPTPITTLDTAIANIGASGLYLSANYPQPDNNPFDPPIIVGTVTGHIQTYMVICRTPPTHLPNQLQKENILPAFNNSFVGIGPFFMWIERYSYPKRQSPYLTLPDRPYSQGGVNSTARKCGIYLFALMCMPYHPFCPFLPPLC